MAIHGLPHHVQDHTHLFTQSINREICTGSSMDETGCCEIFDRPIISTSCDSFNISKNKDESNSNVKKKYGKMELLCVILNKLVSLICNHFPLSPFLQEKDLVELKVKSQFLIESVS